MRINQLDESTTRTLRADVALEKVIPADHAGYWAARVELERAGRYWFANGDGVLTYIQRVGGR